MKKILINHAICISALTSFFLIGCQQANTGSNQAWQQTLTQRAKQFGHRNWIVIADSAYPDQCRNGIETISVNSTQISAIRRLFATLDGMSHVRPIVYTDAELAYVSEKDAPGINSYRQQLGEALGNRAVQTIPHEQIIAKLDAAATTFRVLIIKTNMKLPYTSIFVNLDCGYWNAKAEKHLREALAAQQKP